MLLCFLFKAFQQAQLKMKKLETYLAHSLILLDLVYIVNSPLATTLHHGLKLVVYFETRSGNVNLSTNS